MNNRAFSLIAGTIFGIIAFAHLLRVLMAMSITVGEWIVPMWLSWVAVLIGGSLSYVGLRYASTVRKFQL